MIQKDIELVNEFRRKRDIFLRLEEIATEQVDKLVAAEDYFVMEVSHRTKESESLENKIRKKSGRYKRLTDITDIVGIRIICFFSDDVDKIGKSIENVFDIDRENSVDKRAAISATQFGYLSLHYVCTLPKNAGYDEELTDIPFEIQLRTVLQHTWAEIEHDLGYKSDFGVPREIRREFSRIAGLLEIADEQFVNLRDNTREYTNRIRQKIITDNAKDVLIDRVSLKEYMYHNTSMSEFLKRIAAVTNADIEYINPWAYLTQLEALGLKSIKDLSDMLRINADMAYNMASFVLEAADIDIITSNTALRYLCRAELIRSDFSGEKIREFFALSLDDETEIDKQTKIVLEKRAKNALK